jgi:hypothetical protein
MSLKRLKVFWVAERLRTKLYELQPRGVIAK